MKRYHSSVNDHHGDDMENCDAIMIQKLMIVWREEDSQNEVYDEGAEKEELSVRILYYCNFLHSNLSSNDTSNVVGSAAAVGNIYNSEEAVRFSSLCRALQGMFTALEVGVNGVDYECSDLSEVHFQGSNMLYFPLKGGNENTETSSSFPRIYAVVSVSEDRDLRAVSEIILRLHKIFQLINGNLEDCISHNGNLDLNNIVSDYARLRTIRKKLESFDPKTQNIAIQNQITILNEESAEIQRLIHEKYTAVVESKKLLRNFYDLFVNKINRTSSNDRGHVLSENFLSSNLNNDQGSRCKFCHL